MQEERCLLGCLEGNKNKCHSKLDLESHRFLKRQQGEILNQVQDDVFFYDNGFTLLELLVVVLIIGILAAVAVPKYQKAVLKARLTEVDAIMTTIFKGMQLYVLANGAPTESVYVTDELAIEVKFDSYDNIGNHYNKMGNWRFAIANDAGWIHLYTGSWLKEGYIAQRLEWNSGARMLYAVPEDLSDRKLICQWWIDRYGVGTISNESWGAKSKCAAVGVH